MNVVDKKIEAKPQPEPEKQDEISGPVLAVWPIKIKLRKSILDYKADPISEIEFREPTGGDIVQCGVPVVPSYDTGEIRIDAPKMAAMMARLSTVPPQFIDRMDPVDWITCATALQRFFLPDLQRLLS